LVQHFDMDFFLISFGILLALIGIVGAVIPGLPGPPISFISLILISLTDKIYYSESFYFTFGVLALGITLLDYYVPIYGTKKFGGSRAGVVGSTIGLIVSVFILPFTGIVIGPFGLLGILLGPFIGAWLGETLAGTRGDLALRAAIGSFIGFLAGTLVKLIYSIAVMIIIVRDIIKLIFS
jgi:uncharacterized protein YqgC (DUF456 family)